MTLQTSEIPNQQEFFPKLLGSVFYGKLPPFNEAPNFIDLQGTQILAVINDFRTISTAKLINLLKAQPERPTRLKVWPTEFDQSILLNEKNEITVGSINQGTPYHTSLTLPPPGNKRRLFFHSHPFEATFSPKDLANFFYGVSQDRTLAENLARLPMLPSMQIVMTDNGYYLAFPTRETPIPDRYTGELEEFNDFGSSGNFNTDKKIRLRETRKVYQKILENLMTQFTAKQMTPFLGKALDQNKFFPETVNDKGIALLLLVKILTLRQKYKFCLYFMYKKDTVLKKVAQLTNIFPELSLIG